MNEQFSLFQPPHSIVSLIDIRVRVSAPELCNYVPCALVVSFIARKKIFIQPSRNG